MRPNRYKNNVRFHFSLILFLFALPAAATSDATSCEGSAQARMTLKQLEQVDSKDVPAIQVQMLPRAWSGFRATDALAHYLQKRRANPEPWEARETPPPKSFPAQPSLATLQFIVDDCDFPALLQALKYRRVTERSVASLGEFLRKHNIELPGYAEWAAKQVKDPSGREWTPPEWMMKLSLEGRKTIKLKDLFADREPLRNVLVIDLDLRTVGELLNQPRTLYTTGSLKGRRSEIVLERLEKLGFILN
jgi:hypothetical protein